MKIDLLGKKWLDIVFEGRNKSYGAYDLRKHNSSTNLKALGIGAVVFALAVATPKIAEFISSVTAATDDGLHDRITAVKLPPKEEKPKEDLKPPPPPKPTPPPKQKVTNMIFRAGASAVLFSNRRRLKARAKYSLLHRERVHLGARDAAYKLRVGCFVLCCLAFV